MNKILYLVMLLPLLQIACSPKQMSNKEKLEPYTFTQDSIAIRNVMQLQENAWNKGDLEEFMQGYWNDPKMMFVGGNGVTYGWQQTLMNYIKGYPTQADMGELHFDILEMKSLGTTAARVVGKYRLTKEGSRPYGHFVLVLEKIKGQWLITSDMTAEGKK